MSRTTPRVLGSLFALTAVLVASAAMAQPSAKTKAFAVQPKVLPPVVNPAPARQWYFGMSLLRTRTVYGPGLYVTSVVPGGPAWAAGLERGDVLLSANGVSLQSAVSARHGVSILQSAVSLGGGPVTTTVGYVGSVVPSPSPQPFVHMGVVNVRTNRIVSVTLRPRSTGTPIATAQPTW